MADPSPPTDPDHRYALVLDRWRDIYGPEQWPVSVVGRTLDEIRSLAQHDGENPALLPTRRFGGERVEAGIYRLWRLSDV